MAPVDAADPDFDRAWSSRRARLVLARKCRAMGSARKLEPGQSRLHRGTFPLAVLKAAAAREGIPRQAVAGTAGNFRCRFADLGFCGHLSRPSPLPPTATIPP